ncbi:MAG: D-alanyl-D-alanine carboxypeptidase/D-alanyl-D-alanine endopeptidase, partial [Pseudobdellovibrionaceae bacterium]
MKKIIIVFLMLVQAQSMAFQTEITNRIRRSGLKEKDLGMYIYSQSQKKVLFDLNTHNKKIPASITKLATASAVLAHFPLGYKFKTSLWSKGVIENGVLKGDLYLKGGGDPGFVSENLWYLVNAFTRSEIKKITGSIIVDDQLFDNERYDSSRQSKRVDRAYDAPVGAMSFNWNSVNIFVRPTKKGQTAKVFIDPATSYIQLINKTTTVAGAENQLVAERKEGESKDTIIVSGKIGEKNSEIVIFKNISQPDLWSGHQLKEFLLQRNILIEGSIKTGKIPEGAEVLAENEGSSIEKAITDMNKFSNNYVAEMLTKNIAATPELQNEKAALLTKNASLQQGVLAIEKHLKTIGLSDKEFVFLNPSGLTRDNEFSPYAIWQILDHLSKDFRVFPEFLASLPIAGVDGTLKKRMKNSAAEGWVRAKTGYLDNVVSLAGY